MSQIGLYRDKGNPAEFGPGHPGNLVYFHYPTAGKEWGLLRRGEEEEEEVGQMKLFGHLQNNPSLTLNYAEGTMV